MDGEKTVTVKFTTPVFLGVNGITIMCLGGEVFDIGIVNGVEHEVVNRTLLIFRRDQGADLSKLCLSNVTDMDWMFSNSSFNQPIGNWDVSNVTNMSWMFGDSQFNQNISGWCVRKIGTEPKNFSIKSPWYGPQISDT